MKMKCRMLLCAVSGSLLTAASALPVCPASAAQDGEETEIVMTAVIRMDGTSVQAEGENVTVDGTKITVSASGNYEFSGTLDDGQIIVHVPDENTDAETVKLFFNGVNITGLSEAPVLVENAENTSINLVADTENFLYDGEKYTNTTAVIYAKDDITIKGEGKLRIEAAYQYGIHCNNDVKITGGTVKVKTQTGDAIRGKTSVQVKGGNLDINSEGDGIKSTKGKVLISGGNIDIKASNDAVQAETALQISGGVLKANGDRGLKNEAGSVVITGGTVLATATDDQVVGLDSTQYAVMFQTSTEQVKDQIIALKNTAEDKICFEMIPDKKFDYVMISAPELTADTAYTLLIGGKECAEFTLTDTMTVLEPVTVPADAAVTNFDIDCNGEENILDAIFLARLVQEDTTLAVTDESLERSDLNADGFLTVADTTFLLRYLAGLL
ncbi:MAG: carbohydrate-binding domain-containing protein [Oscillospiraceae bacterium]|nr:carbohydrate-binding domain-containing protein [Oscillospiraceae bacterium]